ncbi:hypothetical protein DFP72DRAFT_1071009 [Ephemerocybe angulata]|uniref:TauD/TfdA-like domain-containing protein n=1 Tax=Ephemerocybe angulata TaxID=980116 RepID=A0A8H6HSJ4_9AGAR|nr:hypothetical protein DFP72DRAFT_1071009 [Tulosesus angulatus]
MDIRSQRLSTRRDRRRLEALPQPRAFPKGRINQSTFPLPTLGPILRDLSRELYSGRGFFVLRTLPVDDYSREDIILIYAGCLVVHRFPPRCPGQGCGGPGPYQGLDRRPTPPKAIGAPAYTTDKQVFHTDAGDIISLFALETAAEGGTSRISSSWRVYNELVKTRPDLIKTLSEPWTHDTYGGDPPFRNRPLLFSEEDKIIIQYARRIFTGFLGLPRSQEIPPITEAQAEALDAIHFLAEKYNLGLNFQKGDIQYINNLSIFHARDAFTDTAEKKRHLLRLWLRDEEHAWKLPKPLEEPWQRLYYTAKEDEHRFPQQPEIRSASKGKGGAAEGGKYV